jgi:hypothetical protein
LLPDETREPAHRRQTRLPGQKPPLKSKEVWAIRIRLQFQHKLRDLVLFNLVTDIKVYFCDPQSPWQRGSNENTNGLLRPYFPKGSDLPVHSQAKLNAVVRQLNERPRKTLNYETPAEQFNACVASID